MVWYYYEIHIFTKYSERFNPHIFTFQALAFFCKKSQLETDIEQEIKEITGKMEGISMVDEFAKYAKLQRKLNALEEQLKVESKTPAIRGHINEFELR